MEWGNVSIPEITVAPVVVSPERDSKTASVRDSSRPGASMNGIHPIVPRTVQNNVTTRNPSLVWSSCFERAVNNHNTRPAEKVIIKELKNAVEVASL